jgi:hypothetical protein
MARNKLLQAPQIQSVEPYVQNVLIGERSTTLLQPPDQPLIAASTQDISIGSLNTDILQPTQEQLSTFDTQDVLIGKKEEDSLLVAPPVETSKEPTINIGIRSSPSSNILFPDACRIPLQTPISYYMDSKENYSGYTYEPAVIGRATNTYSTLQSTTNVGGIEAELDPIFSASPSFTITKEDIARWNAETEGQYGINPNDLKMNGTPFVGTVNAAPRMDHIHPVDTSRQAYSLDLTAIAELSETRGLLKKVNVHTWILDTSSYVTSNSSIIGNTKTKITYDSKGLVTKGEDITAADILNVPHGNILSVNVQSALNELDLKKTSISSLISVTWFTAYDYDIIGERNSSNRVFSIPHNFLPGSPRVHLGGLRLQKGTDWDYTETAPNKITLNYPVSDIELLLIDYIKLN